MADEAAPSIAGKRVLVVEDEFFIAEELRSALEERGVVVLGPVPTAEDARRILAATQQVDAALLDVNLQGRTVYGVADELAERGVPFVFVTGYDRESVPSAYRAARFCEKPVETAEVLRALFP